MNNNDSDGNDGLIMVLGFVIFAALIALLFGGFTMSIIGG